MIENYYNTNIIRLKRVSSKVDGRDQKMFVPDNTFKGAVFTQTAAKVVALGKQTYNIVKTVYCAPTEEIFAGDYVLVDDGEYFVVSKTNTNNLNHHLVLSLSNRD